MQDGGSVTAQGIKFILVGGSLVIVDSGAFFALTRVGLSAAVANVVARMMGAGVGFLLNGVFTFRDRRGPHLGYRRLGRFTTSWIIVTTVSTLTITLFADRLSVEAAWIAKPFIEGTLAIVSFFVSKHWVYH